mgnify:CR=1 FL=1
MKVSNWQASNRPQKKSKKTPRKHQQWLVRFNLMRQELKKGINYPDPTGSFLLSI